MRIVTPISGMLSCSILLILLSSCSNESDFIQLSAQSQRALIEARELNEQTMYVFSGCIVSDEGAHRFNDSEGTLFLIDTTRSSAHFRSCFEDVISRDCNVYLTALFSRSGSVSKIWRIEPQSGDYRLCEDVLPERG